MSKRKKLGIFIPERPTNHLQLDSATNAIGCLSSELHTSVMAELRATNHVELIEDLNFRTALIHDGKVYCGDFCLNDLDRFFWYCEVDRKPGSFDIEVLSTLSRDVEVVRNPERFEVALDKYRAHLRLKDAGAKVSENVLFDFRIPDRMASILEIWGAGVLKPRRGGWGKGVTLIDSAERLQDVIGYIQSITKDSDDQGFFLERYYNNDVSRWTSVTMLNGEIVYGYRKMESKFQDFGDGRSKVLDTDEVGGGVTLVDLQPVHLELAYLAYEALGLDLIGFDMIWTDDGPIIVDENTSPGNYVDLYRETGKDPGRMFANWVLEDL